MKQNLSKEFIRRPDFSLVLNQHETLDVHLKIRQYDDSDLIIVLSKMII